MLHATGVLKVLNCKTQQCEYDHNHICDIYHYILYIVSVISHIRGHRKLQQAVCNTYKTVIENKR